jgi:hypothetical protein
MFIMIALAFPLYGLVDKSSTDLTRALLGEHHLTLDTYEGSAWIALIPLAHLPTDWMKENGGLR